MAWHCVGCDTFKNSDNPHKTPGWVRCDNCGGDSFYEKDPGGVAINKVRDCRPEPEDLTDLLEISIEVLRENQKYRNTVDVWVNTSYMVVGFFDEAHNKMMPEDVTSVWRQNEALYFIFSFVFWSAKTKYRLFDDSHVYRSCLSSYHLGVKNTFEVLNEDNRSFSDDFLSWPDYLNREKEYLELLANGGNNFFRICSVSVLRPASKRMVDYSCKRYVYSYKAMVKTIESWFTDVFIYIQEHLPEKLAP